MSNIQQCPGCLRKQAEIDYLRKQQDYFVSELVKLEQHRTNVQITMTEEEYKKLRPL